MIRGKPVSENEYVDRTYIMARNDLHEIESIGRRFTWFNKHNEDHVYPRIDRGIGNMAWMQSSMDIVVHILDPGISYHAML